MSGNNHNEIKLCLWNGEEWMPIGQSMTDEEIINLCDRAVACEYNKRDYKWEPVENSD